ncbi:MAG: histidyl-tRNA synthetase [Solirubrobacterales bacterium]|jgi:histidyl-tRNA synthetase|nr:histidyl-tRNA synthetase [Solirubrobacterales bacterium]
MASKFQAPRGTFDVLPEDARRRAVVEATAREIFARAGYEGIQTPSFEHTDLFERGVGRSTDIVRKEMFTFEDKGERSLTLRPEGTAPICRAYLEHGMHKLAQPVKLSYVGPFFRHERPQAGRYRQFHQLGLECIGTDSPLADAEAIILLAELLSELGVPGVELRIGSLGSFGARQDYLEELKAHLRKHEGDLSRDVRERIDVNPLRAFDADDPGTQGVMASAPTIVDSLQGEDAEHFAEVKALLDAAGVSYVVDKTLVRGLDYYTRTIFSFVCDALGAQSEIGGGGRYDGLIEQLGGPATPAVGWAAGIERILLALGEEVEAEAGPVRVFISFSGEDGRRALVLADELRRAGFAAELDLAQRGVKGQLKHANRIGARFVVLLSQPEGPQLREMESGEQRAVDLANLVDEMTGGEA